MTEIDFFLKNDLRNALQINSLRYCNVLDISTYQWA